MFLSQRSHRLRSRTVGFPESGSGLGSVPISQAGLPPSPSARNCSAGAPFAPTRWSLPRPFATTQAPQNPALCLVRTRPSWPPSAQSPFARSGRYPRRGGLEGRLEGRYPLVVARTSSCARPPPSPRLGSRLAHGVFAGSRQSLLGDGPSRHYLCDPCVSARTPTPPRSSAAHIRFFAEDTGLTPRRRVRRAKLPRHSNFGGKPNFEAAVIRLSSGSYARSAPRLLPPQRR